MRLERIIRAVSRAYDPHEPDMVFRAWSGAEVHDTLALFIARELKDCYQPRSADQIMVLVDAMGVAIKELSRVQAALLSLRRR